MVFFDNLKMVFPTRKNADFWKKNADCVTLRTYHAPVMDAKGCFCANCTHIKVCARPRAQTAALFDFKIM